MPAALPVLDPGNRNVLPNPGLIPANLNLGRTPLFGGYGNRLAPPISTFGDPNSFNAAVDTQANDYDTIMSNYDKLLSTAKPMQKVGYTPITPQLSSFQSVNYTPSNGTGINSLREATTTGGFSEGDVGNIRARAVSPIRSIYANAQRNLVRNRSLQGGYSPNFAASSAKMARELSEQIGQANTNVEGTIAEMIARNKLSAISSLAPLEAEESRIQNQVNIANAEGVNRTNQYNSELINRTNEQNRLLPLQYAGFNNDIDSNNMTRQLQAIEGKKSLYGTTPALINTFGNQVLQGENLKMSAAQIKEAEKQSLRSMALGLVDAFGRPRTTLSGGRG